MIKSSFPLWAALTFDLVFAGRTPLAKSPTRSGTTEPQTGWPVALCVKVVLSCRCCCRNVFWSSSSTFLLELNAAEAFCRNLFGESNACFLCARKESPDLKPTLPKKSSVEVKKVKQRCELTGQETFRRHIMVVYFSCRGCRFKVSSAWLVNSCCCVVAGRTQRRSKLGNDSRPSRNPKGLTRLRRSEPKNIKRK